LRPLPLGVSGRHEERERAGGEDDDVEESAHPVVDDHPREPFDPPLPEGVNGKQRDADADDARAAQNPLVLLGDHHVEEEDEERRGHNDDLGNDAVYAGHQRLEIYGDRRHRFLTSLPSK
jgi:hypothetical protein